jgi:hypothetical protein
MCPLMLTWRLSANKERAYLRSPSIHHRRRTKLSKSLSAKRRESHIHPPTPRPSHLERYTHRTVSPAHTTSAERCPSSVACWEAVLQPQTQRWRCTFRSWKHPKPRRIARVWHSNAGIGSCAKWSAPTKLPPDGRYWNTDVQAVNTCVSSNDPPTIARSIWFAATAASPPRSTLSGKVRQSFCVECECVYVCVCVWYHVFLLCGYECVC